MNPVLKSSLPKCVRRSKKCCNRAGRQLARPPHALSISLSLHKGLDTSKFTFPLQTSFKNVWFRVCNFSPELCQPLRSHPAVFCPTARVHPGQAWWRVYDYGGNQPFSHLPEELISQLHHRRGVTGSLETSPKSKFSSTKLPRDKPLHLTPKSWGYV